MKKPLTIGTLLTSKRSHKTFRVWKVDIHSRDPDMIQYHCLAMGATNFQESFKLTPYDLTAFIIKEGCEMSKSIAAQHTAEFEAAVGTEIKDVPAPGSLIVGGPSSSSVGKRFWVLRTEETPQGKIWVYVRDEDNQSNKEIPLSLPTLKRHYLLVWEPKNKNSNPLTRIIPAGLSGSDIRKATRVAEKQAGVKRPVKRAVTPVEESPKPKPRMAVRRVKNKREVLADAFKEIINETKNYSEAELVNLLGAKFPDASTNENPTLVTMFGNFLAHMGLFEHREGKFIPIAAIVKREE
jgi:hypothetical protein